MRFDLDAIDAPAAESGTPKSIALTDIDEDPEQPRSEFDDESLRELAATIRERGVKQPVSVRPHPSQAGRWMLNFGARRLRAARLAGLEQIPAFVDESADSYDQVIENEQREGLRPLDLAMFVKRRIAAGDSQAEIARRLGKSPTLITMVSAMIDPPPWLLQAYRSGQCKGVAELYELRRLHERAPDRALELVAKREPITRAVLQGAKSDRQAAPAVASNAAPAMKPHRSNADSGVSAASPAVPRNEDLLARATVHCDALASIVERIRVCEPDRLPALHERLVAVCASCLTR
jgi:ParB family transcriptional regulator, chromosome partitioning protein